MNYSSLLKKLQPVNFGTFDVEPFDSYKERVKDILPNWPECPLENWLYRHYTWAIMPYAWLRFDKMQFYPISLERERIYKEVGTHKIEMLDGQGKQIYSRNRSNLTWLQKYFWDHGTWPVPIIVLENKQGIIDTHGNVYGQPYHLLEGHLRLGYFRNIFRHNKNDLKEEHKVWRVTIIKSPR